MIKWRDKHARLRRTMEKHLDYYGTKNTDPDTVIKAGLHSSARYVFI